MTEIKYYESLVVVLGLLLIIPAPGYSELPAGSRPTGYQTKATSTSTSETEPQNYNFYRNHWFVGVTYPGLNCGYRNKYFSLELRGFSAQDVKLLGPRLTTPLARYRTIKFYWGIDALKVYDFEGELTEGEGHMVGPVIGFEKFFDERFSFTLDSGPYFIKLEDDLSGQDVDGLEFVVNTGINFYF